MSRFVSVPGTNTMYATTPASLLDNVADPRRADRDYYKRSRASNSDPRSFFSRWPVRSGFQSDPAAPASLIASDDVSGSDGWGPWECGYGGNAGQKFITGQCLDSVGAPVSGAVVQAFRTSDDVLVAETTADSNGQYEAGRCETGVSHYLVAYRAGSPDIAGTTVNTLTGTNRDGT